MGGGGIIAVVGLAFSMVAIRLMMVVESTQIVFVDVIGQQLPRKSSRLVILISAKKFFLLKIGIVFFGRISSLIFLAQEMYLEKTVQSAASTMMNTFVTSNKMISKAATNTRYAAKKMKKKAHHYYRQSRQQLQRQ